MTTHATAAAIREFIDDNENFARISDDVLQMLTDANENFALAPDEFLIIKRLPPTVTNLTTLIAYLSSIKNRLENRPTNISNQDWDVAQSGQLKQYKMYACAIHAVVSYAAQQGNRNAVQRVVVLADACIAHGRQNPPTGMSANGSRMWEASFSPTSRHMGVVMKSLLFFIRAEMNGALAVAAAPGNDGGDNQNQAQGANQNTDGGGALQPDNNGGENTPQRNNADGREDETST